MSADPATFAEAESRLAALDYAEGRVAEAHKRLDAVLARMPKNAPVLVMKAQWLTKENKLDEALERAKAAVAADPNRRPRISRWRPSTIAAGRWPMPSSRTTRCCGSIRARRPRKVELSRLSLTSGDGTAALRYAEEARRRRPRIWKLGVALARSLIADRKSGASGSRNRRTSQGGAERGSRARA